MTMSMAIFALIAWLKRPYGGNKAQVKVNGIGKTESILMWFVALIVSLIFFFIFRHFNTANIIPSTISVTTSFIAVHLTFRRSRFFR